MLSWIFNRRQNDYEEIVDTVSREEYLKIVRQRIGDKPNVMKKIEESLDSQPQSLTFASLFHF